LLFYYNCRNVGGCLKGVGPFVESTSFPPNPLMTLSAVVEFASHEVSDRRELTSK
jgi:hypothetical protein